MNRRLHRTYRTFKMRIEIISWCVRLNCMRYLTRFRGIIDSKQENSNMNERIRVQLTNYLVTLCHFCALYIFQNHKFIKCSAICDTMKSLMWFWKQCCRFPFILFNTEFILNCLKTFNLLRETALCPGEMLFKIKIKLKRDQFADSIKSTYEICWRILIFCCDWTLKHWKHAKHSIP